MIASKGLVINETSSDKFFSTPLWGTVESAAKNAVIVFYEIVRNDGGGIVDVTFNFVERSEFEKTYEWLN